MKSIAYHNDLPQNWWSRFKLYHIPFWCLYHYIWWTVAMGDPLQSAKAILFSPFTAKFVFM
ncbi:hypothetical protein [Paraflavitalea speifideaquila]|uniref:hypothetical protein n=1 Tax=Paraflavitalea speifideaquila TaxID=3076558 RepID=UPI0028E93619|nr:hypothetical protein [Paraflavitalea speifideiaquila]